MSYAGPTNKGRVIINYLHNCYNQTKYNQIYTVPDITIKVKFEYYAALPSDIGGNLSVKFRVQSSVTSSSPDVFNVLFVYMLLCVV